MMNRETRVMVAAVQAVIGSEWLVSGANKVLLGTFPQGLAARLQAGLQDNSNHWYVALLRALVLPHTIFFGFVIESTELTIGVVLVCGALLLLGPVRPAGEPQHRLGVTFVTATLIAAIASIILCVNFHFWMGDGIVPTVRPGSAFDEGIDLDTLLPPLSLIIAVANLRLLDVLTGGAMRAWLGRSLSQIRMMLLHRTGEAGA